MVATSVRNAVLLGGAKPNDQNIVPNAWLDLNFVEGIYKLDGLDTTPAAVLDFSNGGGRTVKDSQGNDVAFAQNALPITDAGLYLSDTTFNDICSVKDTYGQTLLALLSSGGFTAFIEFVQNADANAHNPLFAWDNTTTFDAGIFLATCGGSTFCGSSSFGNTNDLGIGPDGDSSGNVQGSIVRIAIALAPGDVAQAMSLFPPFHVQTATTIFADFSAGKIYVGSNRFGNLANTFIRRIAFAKSRRPNAELTNFASGASAPPYANSKFASQISGAAASLLPLLGANTHTDPFNAPSITAAQQVSMVNAVGLDIVRLDLSWQTIEPAGNGTYDFSHYDDTITALLGAGKQVLLMLGYGHTAYTAGSGAPPITSGARTAYTNLAKAVANKYPTASIEVENEQNLPQFTNSAPDASLSAALVTAAAAGIKSVQPGVKVITGGLSSANWNAPVAFATTFMGAVTATNVTGYAFHPYVQTGPINPTQIPEFAVTMDAAMFAVMTGKEKWNTESGFPLSWTGDYYTQARYNIRGYIASVKAQLKAHIHYDLADDGPNQSDDEQTYGMFDYLRSIKPTGTAFQGLATLKAATVTYDVDAVPGFRLSAVTFHKASGKSIALVAEVLNVNFVRDVGAYSSVSATDVFGNVVPVKRLAGNVVKVAVSSARCPVILNVA